MTRVVLCSVVLCCVFIIIIICLTKVNQHSTYYEQYPFISVLKQINFLHSKIQKTPAFACGRYVKFKTNILIVGRQKTIFLT
jgi:hypothetical protein